MEKLNDSSVIESPSRKRSLLIVDDSDFIRGRLAAMVQETDYYGTVFQAKDSFQAYEIFFASLPDIVILDIHIPGDNGIKVLEKLKKARPEVQIFILTNYPYDQYRKRCIELGADYFFEKNRDMDKLTEVLEYTFK